MRLAPPDTVAGLAEDIEADRPSQMKIDRHLAPHAGRKCSDGWLRKSGRVLGVEPYVNDNNETFAAPGAVRAMAAVTLWIAPVHDANRPVLRSLRKSTVPQLAVHRFLRSRL